MWVRTGAGQYKNKATGKVLSGQATDPNKNPKFNKAKPVGPVTGGNAVAGPAQAENPALSQSLQGLAAAGTSPMQRTITADNFAPQRAAFEKQQYDALTAGYADRQKQQQQQLEQDLYNRGYRPDQTTTQGAGSWNGMTESFNKSWNDAYLQAGAKAGEMGGQEFDRMFNAQEAARGLDIERELGMGSLAQGQRQLTSQEKIAAAQRKNNLRIAQMQLARSGGAGGGAAAPVEDPGFDILGGTF